MHFLDRLVEWAHESLACSDEAVSYLTSRGSSREQWDRHGIGFVPGDFDVDPSECAGHSDGVCGVREMLGRWCDACRYRRWSSTWEAEEEGGPKGQRVGRRIAGSLVFPLTSYSGSTVGIQVRSVKEKVYDTFTLARRPEGYFFGTAANVAEVWRRKEVAIVEGPFDLLVLERLVTPTVLALTTSAVSPAQMRFLRRFVRRIYMCLDLDHAGKLGRASMINRAWSDFDLVRVDYPQMAEGDKDVGDFWKRAGDAAFRRHFKREIPV